MLLIVFALSTAASFPVYADGITSWTCDQYKVPGDIRNWEKGDLERFVYTVNEAESEFAQQNYEASNYWVQEARDAKHHTVSYYVDMGDLHHRVDQPRAGLSYYHMAHNLRRKTVEDNLELGRAFLYAGRPNMADYYFTEATKYARSRYDWLNISEAFQEAGNEAMVKWASKRGMRLR